MERSKEATGRGLRIDLNRRDPRRPVGPGEATASQQPADGNRGRSPPRPPRPWPRRRGCFTGYIAACEVAWAAFEGHDRGLAGGCGSIAIRIVRKVAEMTPTCP